MTKFKLCIYGLLTGIINALFGAGGGIITVAVLKKTYNNQKKAQATAVAVILPMTILTAIRYLSLGYMSYSDALPYIIPGFFGAIVGSILLKKTNNKILKVIFALIMLWAGMRLIFK